MEAREDSHHVQEMEEDDLNGWAHCPERQRQDQAALRHQLTKEAAAEALVVVWTWKDVDHRSQIELCDA